MEVDVAKNKDDALRIADLIIRDWVNDRLTASDAMHKIKDEFGRLGIPLWVRDFSTIE